MSLTSLWQIVGNPPSGQRTPGACSTVKLFPHAQMHCTYSFGSANGGETRSGKSDKPSLRCRGHHWGETQSGRSMQKGSRPICGAEQQLMEVYVPFLGPGIAI